MTFSNDFDKASDHINSVIRIAPTHEKLATVQREIIDQKEIYLEEQAERKRSQQQTSPPTTESNQKKRRTYVGF